MATKMLFEMWLPQAIAKAKENISKAELWKYLRYYRMYMERFRWLDKDGKDITRAIERTLLFRGCVVLVDTEMHGTVVCELEDKGLHLDPNNYPDSVDCTSLNGELKFKNKKLGKDCVIIYADSTHIAPILYLWAIANDILEVQDIIRTQNNMLRKPILVAGEGAGLDNAISKIANVLSGVEFMNLNDRKGKAQTNVMAQEQPLQVLNLQAGNSYKGTELWDNFKHHEEFICDYLGYTTTKNEKRERMNSLEITNENSIGMTFYNSQVYERENPIKNFSGGVKFEKLLEIDEGGESNGNQKEMV